MWYFGVYLLFLNFLRAKTAILFYEWKTMTVRLDKYR